MNKLVKELSAQINLKYWETIDNISKIQKINRTWSDSILTLLTEIKNIKQRFQQTLDDIEDTVNKTLPYLNLNDLFLKKTKSQNELWFANIELSIEKLNEDLHICQQNAQKLKNECSKTNEVYNLYVNTEKPIDEAPPIYLTMCLMTQKALKGNDIMDQYLPFYLYQDFEKQHKSINNNMIILDTSTWLIGIISKMRYNKVDMSLIEKQTKLFKYYQKYFVRVYNDSPEIDIPEDTHLHFSKNIQN
jgi:hypothetical protein